MTGVIFQSHHVIEKSVFRESKILKELSARGLFSINATENLLNLPMSSLLGDELEISTHSGGPLSSYSTEIRGALSEIEDSTDYQRSLSGDKLATQRVVDKINNLRDAVKVGMINPGYSSARVIHQPGLFISPGYSSARVIHQGAD